MDGGDTSSPEASGLVPAPGAVRGETGQARQWLMRMPDSQPLRIHAVSSSRRINIENAPAWMSWLLAGLLLSGLG